MTERYSELKKMDLLEDRNKINRLRWFNKAKRLPKMITKLKSNETCRKAMNMVTEPCGDGCGKKTQKCYIFTILQSFQHSWKTIILKLTTYVPSKYRNMQRESPNKIINVHIYIISTNTIHLTLNHFSSHHRSSLGQQKWRLPTMPHSKLM
jgi:hypothetical protein